MALVGRAARVLHDEARAALGPSIVDRLPDHDLASEVRSTLRAGEHVRALLPEVGRQFDDVAAGVVRALEGSRATRRASSTATSSPTTSSSTTAESGCSTWTASASATPLSTWASSWRTCAGVPAASRGPAPPGCPARRLWSGHRRPVGEGRSTRRPLRAEVRGPALCRARPGGGRAGCARRWTWRSPPSPRQRGRGDGLLALDLDAATRLAVLDPALAQLAAAATRRRRQRLAAARRAVDPRPGLPARLSRAHRRGLPDLCRRQRHPGRLDPARLPGGRPPAWAGSGCRPGCGGGTARGCLRGTRAALLGGAGEVPSRPAVRAALRDPDGGRPGDLLRQGLPSQRVHGDRPGRGRPREQSRRQRPRASACRCVARRPRHRGGCRRGALGVVGPP